jgi:hypothetical protein
VRNRIIVVAALLCVVAAPARAQSDDREAVYRLSIERVQKHADDFWLDGTPQARRALDRAWTSLADWTAAYLNAHPDATPKRIKRAAPGGDLDVVPLGPRTLAVSAEAGSAFGTVFIVDGSGGPFRPAWSIRSRAARAAFPLLGAWTAKAASGHCRDAAADWARCGPLAGTVRRLPDDAQGHPRFAVEAFYAQAAGNTQLDQLSIWTWTGTTAVPLLATTFGTNLDDEPARLDGDVLTLRTAENYRMIAPWWDHFDRALDWRLRIGPDGIDDLGKTPVVPEMEAIDELLFRVAHGVTAGDLAPPDVQAQLARIMAGTTSLAMAGGFILRHQGAAALVCLPTDETGSLTFTLTGAFVSRLAIAPNDLGSGCANDKP